MHATHFLHTQIPGTADEPQGISQTTNDGVGSIKGREVVHAPTTKLSTAIVTHIPTANVPHSTGIASAPIILATVYLVDDAHTIQ